MLAATLAGGFLAVGLVLAVAAVRGVPVDQNVPSLPRDPARHARISRRTALLLAAGLAAGVLGWLITGWVLLILAGPAAVVVVPTLLSGREAADRIARVEAMSEWTRSLAGVLTVGLGLKQALEASQRSAPPAIAPEVGRLVARLHARWPTEAAIRAFADDLNDATGDLIAANLLLAARRPGAGLSAILESLADSVAAEVRGRRQVEADRAKPRAAARWTTIISAAVLTILALTGTYTDPYRTPLGQVILVVLLAGYVAVLVWMNRMARGKQPPRLLARGHQHASSPAHRPAAVTRAREAS